MIKQRAFAGRTRGCLLGLAKGDAAAAKIKSVAVILTLALAVLPWRAAKADVVIQAEKAGIRTEGGPASGGGWNLWSNGHVGQPVRVAATGTYRVVVCAWGSSAAGVWPEMALLVDGRAVKTVSVDQAKPKDYPFQVELTTGVHEVAAAFLNDALVGKEDRNLYLARITIIQPSGAPDPTFPSVKEMAEALAITPSAVSQHLKVLRYAGLVRNERKGYTLPYEIDHTAMAKCKEVITEVCNCGCKGSCQAQDKNVDGPEDDLALLMKRERELQEELQELRARIKEMKGE